MCYEILCSLQNHKCAKGLRGSCTCYNNDSSVRYSICKYMQILLTHCICVISAQKKMSTLLYFGSHCLPYFLPHQLGMLKHPQCLAETCVYFTFLWASLPVMLSRATVEHRGTGALAIQAHSEIWSVIFSLSAGSRSHSWLVFYTLELMSVQQDSSLGLFWVKYFIIAVIAWDQLLQEHVNNLNWNVFYIWILHM